MQILNTYSIYDTAAAVYVKPIFCRNHSEVERSLEQLFLHDPEHLYNTHTSQFEIVLTGHWNDEDGTFVEPAESYRKPLSEIKAKLRLNVELEIPLDIPLNPINEKVNTGE